MGTTLFKGCYKAMKYRTIPPTPNRGKLLLTYRYDIEWENRRNSPFAHSFVCACAMAARANRVKTFATHFWGECYEMKEWELKEKAIGCELADGLYSEECTDGFTRSECIGTTDFAAYTYTFFAITDDMVEESKRQLEEYKRSIGQDEGSIEDDKRSIEEDKRSIEEEHPEYIIEEVLKIQDD